jgi:hypothetical protein
MGKPVQLSDHAQIACCHLPLLFTCIDSHHVTIIHYAISPPPGGFVGTIAKRKIAFGIWFWKFCYTCNTLYELCIMQIRGRGSEKKIIEDDRALVRISELRRILYI